MDLFYFLLLLGAVLSFLLAAVGVVISTGRQQLNLIALGLFLATLVPCIETYKAL